MPNTSTDRTFGQRLAYYRERKGWSQLELAMEADTCQSAIARMERDVWGNIRVYTLKRLAHALGITCGELLD